MPTEKLTQAFVSSATCPAGKQKIDYFDTDLPGLLLKVMPTGKRTYYVRYKDTHGRTKERKLVDASVIDLSDARQRVKTCLANITLGLDPFSDKQQKRQIPTLNDFISSTYLPYIKASKKSWKVDEAAFRLHVQPALGKLYLDDITQQDVQSLMVEHSKRHKPASSNRMLNVLHRLFVFALNLELPGLTKNPARKISKLKENNHRDRYLSGTELRALWKELDISNSITVSSIVKVLLLTGARKSEVTNAKWNDIDFQKNSWRIPDSKSGKARHVPLSQHVLEIIDNMQRFDGCDYIFPNPKTMKPYINFYHTWNSIRKKANINDIRVHDLRHTYASYLVNNDISIYEVKELLGHSNVTTTQRYSHLSNSKLLKSASVVGSYIKTTISSSADNRAINHVA